MDAGGKAQSPARAKKITPARKKNSFHIGRFRVGRGRTFSIAIAIYFWPAPLTAGTPSTLNADQPQIGTGKVEF